jgi:hypothetical protein
MTQKEEFFNMERSHAKTQICRMKLFVMVVIMVCALKGFSQVEGTTINMMSMSALAYQDIEQDVFSSLNIISAAAHIKKTQIGMYCENRFMVKGMGKAQAVFCFPLKKAGVGVTADYQGMINLNFIGVTGGYGMDVSNKISVGLKIESGRVIYPSRNKKYLIGYQAGFIIKANEKTQVGIHLTERFIPSTSKSLNQPGLYIINAGIGHSINEMVYLSCEIIKIKNTNAYISPYIKWHVNESFHIQGGILQPLNSGYIGLGWKKNKENISFSFATHSHLGLSGSLNLVHDFN